MLYAIDCGLQRRKEHCRPMNFSSRTATHYVKHLVHLSLKLYCFGVTSLIKADKLIIANIL